MFASMASKTFWMPDCTHTTQKSPLTNLGVTTSTNPTVSKQNITTLLGYRPFETVNIQLS